MLGLLTSDFGYQNRLMLLQQLIECGDVLLGRELVCDYGIDNRISNSRSPVSPDGVNKDLGLSESDEEVTATTTTLGPLLSPIESASPSSGSSSPSDSESESSSAESTVAPTPAAPTPAPAPAQRTSWSLSNFVPSQAQQPTDQRPDYDPSKEVRHALAEVKGKPSPISEMSDSEASSPSPGPARRRRSIANRASNASSDDEAPPRPRNPILASPVNTAPQKRGRPPKPRTPEERPAKKRRGRPPKHRPPSPPGPGPAPPPAPITTVDSDVEPDPPQHHHPLQDTKTHIFRKVFTPKKGDECGGKGGKGGKGKGGKGKGQVTIIEVTPPESGANDDDRRHRDRSVERRNEEAIARVSPPHEPETLTRRREADRVANERIQECVSIERNDHRRSADRMNDRPTERMPIPTERTRPEKSNRLSVPHQIPPERISEKYERISEKIPHERLSADKMSMEKKPHERLSGDKIRLSDDKMSIERLHEEKVERLSGDKISMDRLSTEKATMERLSDDKLERGKSDRTERVVPDRYVRAEADVGSGLKPGRGSERLEEASSNLSCRARVMVRVPLARLRAETVRTLQRPPRPPIKRPTTPHHHPGGVVAATNHERSTACSGQTPIYYSYFERQPADALSDEERDHKYYLDEATRLRTAAEREQEPLPRVMLYLESVLCFVLTGRVLELELDTKGAFTVYRETIEYIKSIHSMPQRFRASPHSTFSKLDILSLRVQALLYLRMFKMYNRDVKEYNKIVQEYQQKPASAESVSSASGVSPLSPSPSPAGSLGSVGSVGSAGSAGSGSGSSGYCSVAHSVPAHAHNALLQLTKYYTFLYVALDLWEQADCLCRLRANRDLFIAVDRKCGPLSLSSTFRHLVQYIRHAISLLKSSPRE